jgi:hypothetical protein
MTTLNQQEIEQLQYALRVYMQETFDESEDIISLDNKLSIIREELEVADYPSYNISDEDVLNSI